jgi:transcriptional regulator with XRE-family HTH domain
VPASKPADQPSFGRLLRLHRERRGLTLTALRKQCGIDVGNLSRIERGDRLPPKMPVLIELLRALGRGHLKNRKGLPQLDNALLTPDSNRFIRDDNSAFGEKILDISEAQAEAMINPHGIADDLWRETMTVIARPAVFHRTSVSVRCPS